MAVPAAGGAPTMGVAVTVAVMGAAGTVRVMVDGMAPMMAGFCGICGAQMPARKDRADCTSTSEPP